MLDIPTISRPSPIERDFGIVHHGLRYYLGVTAISKLPAADCLTLFDSMGNSDEPIVTLGAASVLTELATNHREPLEPQERQLLLGRAQGCSNTAADQAAARLGREEDSRQERLLKDVGFRARFWQAHAPLTEAIALDTPTNRMAAPLAATYDRLMGFSRNLLDTYEGEGLKNAPFEKQISHKDFANQALVSALIHRPRNPKLIAPPAPLRAVYNARDSVRSHLTALYVKGGAKRAVRIHTRGTHKGITLQNPKKLIIGSSPHLVLQREATSFSTLRYLTEVQAGHDRDEVIESQITNMEDWLKQQVAGYVTDRFREPASTG